MVNIPHKNDSANELFQILHSNEHRTFLYNMTTMLLKIFPILFLIIGTIGNSLSFIILTSKKLRKTSTFCYLACLSLVDFAVTYTFSINFILIQYFNIDIQIKSVSICRIYAFLVYFLPQYSAWILVLVSVDRVFKIIMCSGKLIWSMKSGSFFLFKYCLQKTDTEPTVTVTNNNDDCKMTKFDKNVTTKKKRLLNAFIKKWNTPKGSIISVLLTGVILFIINIQFFVFQIDQYSGISKINEFEKNVSLLTPEELVKNLADSIDQLEKYKTYYKTKIYEVNPIICSPENNKRYLKFYRNYWVHIDTLINVFIPSAIMFISSLIICSTIRKSILKFRRRSRLVSVFYENRHEENTKQQPKQQQKQMQNVKKSCSNCNKSEAAAQSGSFFSTSVSNFNISPLRRKNSHLKPDYKVPGPSIRRYSSVPSNINIMFQQTVVLIEDKKPDKNKTAIANFGKYFICNMCMNCIRILKKPKLKAPLKKPDKIYILIILVAINVLFISLTAPIVLYLSFQTKQIYDLENMELMIRVRFIKALCVCLMNANHAINIMIYGMLLNTFVFYITCSEKLELLYGRFRKYS